MAGFTALNGGEYKTSEGATGSPRVRHGGSKDRSAIQIISQDTRPVVTSVAWMEQGSGFSPKRSRYQSTSYSDVQGTYKCKWSVSVERPREAAVIQDQDQRSQVESKRSYEISARERDYRHYGEDQREHANLWYYQQSRDDRNWYESRELPGSAPKQGNEQMGETLRRATSHAESAHNSSTTSPGGDDSMLYSGGHSQDSSGDLVVKSDPKKRKRNFCNRTKTGCLTCRKRKKKCDESKPECTNCIRLGFVCYRYPDQRDIFPTPISANTPSVQQLKRPSIERPREYQRVPPLHDITRTKPDSNRPDTPRPGSLPQMNILEPTPPAVLGPQPQPSTDPQMAAQIALALAQYPPNNNKPRTQKEEMLIGREYYPFDPELVLERQRCSAACWRFNNSTNPNTAVSATERSRLFREILNAREPINLSPQIVSSGTTDGRIRHEVIVEAPFTCDYGYNIKISNNVLIGRNCTILDPVEISIGNNCFIGPNVTLLGATTFTDPKKRMGSKSLQIGGYIVIDKHV